MMMMMTTVMMMNADKFERRQMNEEVAINDEFLDDEVLQLPRMLQQRQQQEEEEEEDGFDDDPSSFPPDNGTGTGTTGQQCTIQPWVDERPKFLQFVNTASIRFLHERIPRFGNSRNITNFIIDIKTGGGGGSDGETDFSYVWGIAAPCLCIVSIAGFWAIILLICRYVLRTKRVGWLSGRFRPLPPRPKQKQKQKQKPKPPVEEGNEAVETETEIGNRTSTTESYSNKIQGEEGEEEERERNDDDEEAMRYTSSIITDPTKIEDDSISTQQQNQRDGEMAPGIQVQRLDEETGDGRLGDVNDELSGQDDDRTTNDHHIDDDNEQQQVYQQSTFARFVENFINEWFGRDDGKNADGSGEASKMTGSCDTGETMSPSGSTSEGSTDTTMLMLSLNNPKAKVGSSKRTSRPKESEINDSAAFHLIHDLDATFHVSFKGEGTGQENRSLTKTTGVPLSMTPRRSELRRLIHDLDSAFHFSFRGGETVQIDPSPAATAAGTKPVQASEMEKSTSMKIDHAKARMVKTLLTGKMMSSFRSCDGSMTSKFGGQSDDFLQGHNAPEYPGSSDESSQYQKQQDVLLARCDDDLDQAYELYKKDDQLQNKVGVEGQEENDDEMSWIRRYNRVRWLREFFRGICCVCALAVVVGTILMIIQGVRYMNSTFENLIESLGLGQDLILQASNITGDAIGIVGRLKNDTIALLLSLNGICPLIREKVCSVSFSFTSDTCEAVESNITLITLFSEWQNENKIGNGEVLDGIGDLVQEFDKNVSSFIQEASSDTVSSVSNFDFETASMMVIEGAIGTACRWSEIGTSILCDTEGILTTRITRKLAALVDKANWLLPDVISFNEDLMSTYEMLEGYKSTVSTFDWALSLSLFFMILSSSVALFLLGVLVFPRFASSRVVQRIHKYWAFPIFLLSAFLSLIFTCVFLLGSTSMADFCFDGPDENLLAMAAEFGSNKQSIFPQKTMYEFLRFYLRRCENPLPTLELLDEIVDENDQYLLGFEEELVDLSLRITDACGTDGSGALFLAATTARVRDFACTMTNLVRSFRDLIRCSNIRLLYEQVMYQTICFTASDACWWLAATNFFVVGCSLLLITFRSAFAEIEILDDDRSKGTDMQAPTDTDIKGLEDGDESSEKATRDLPEQSHTLATKPKRWTM